jgi:hypothetical protein
MGVATASRIVSVTPAVAERCWYDTDGWPAWVEGLEEVCEVDAAWPESGATVVWQSAPAGRGRVTEHVLAHAPGEGQTVVVSDRSISGRQLVAFAPAAGGAEVALRLEYDIRAASLITPLVDVLFIRRAMTASLRHTLERFAVRCAAI